MTATSVVFLTDLNGEALDRAISCFGGASCSVVKSMPDLSAARGDALLSFSTSLIVPSDILNCYAGSAYNLHAASPEFPGRDPHHWAVYNCASRYGATLHVMTEKVDAGPIVDVELFEVRPGVSPCELLAQANESAFTILERAAPRLAAGEVLPELEDMQWGLHKKSRNDFFDICKITEAISQEEFERRYRAFDSGKFNNLTFEFYGHIFRIEK